jgi:hypothetical protein
MSASKYEQKKTIIGGKETYYSPAHELEGSISSAPSGRCRNMSAGKSAQKRPVIGRKEAYHRRE